MFYLFIYYDKAEKRLEVRHKSIKQTSINHTHIVPSPHARPDATRRRVLTMNCLNSLSSTKLYATGLNWTMGQLAVESYEQETSQRSTNCHQNILNALRSSQFFYPRPRWLGSRVVSVLDSGAEGPGFKSQSRRCRVTVLGKLFTPIVPLFTKQQN